MSAPTRLQVSRALVQAEFQKWFPTLCDAKSRLCTLPNPAGNDFKLVLLEFLTALVRPFHALYIIGF